MDVTFQVLNCHVLLYLLLLLQGRYNIIIVTTLLLVLHPCAVYGYCTPTALVYEVVSAYLCICRTTEKRSTTNIM